MSLFEIFDLIIYNALVKLTPRRRVPDKPQVLNASSVQSVEPVESVEVARL